MAEPQEAIVSSTALVPFRPSASERNKFSLPCFLFLSSLDLLSYSG
jgi:hypothetical protein